MNINKKYINLIEQIKSYKKVIVAFSGGVDSTFLLYAAIYALGIENVIAVVAESNTYQKREKNSALKYLEESKCTYEIIHTKEFDNINFQNNPKNRCYYCKTELYNKIGDIANKNNIKHILDGSNASDKDDYRPGMKALHELKIKTPLLDCGLTKDDIRKLSKKFHVPTYNKPAMACLASRIPYGTKINIDTLNRVEHAENYLTDLGIKGSVRVRCFYDTVAIIEVQDNEYDIIIQNREDINNKFLLMGFTKVSVNLAAYKTGNMNIM